MANPVEFSDQAKLQIQHLSQTEANKSKPLRLYISGKGCDGFEYGVAFDECLEGDSSFNLADVKIVIDPQALQFISGCQVDFVDDERGRGFLVTNPRQKMFRGKFFKRTNWQERISESVKGKLSEETSP